MGNVTVSICGPLDDVEAVLDAIRKAVHHAPHVSIEFESDNHTRKQAHAKSGVVRRDLMFVVRGTTQRRADRRGRYVTADGEQDEATKIA